MEEHDKNKMFKFFMEVHDILLTQDEIDEIIEKVSKYDDEHLVRIVIHRLNMYRTINAVVLLMLILPCHLWYPRAIPWMCYIFVAYNIIHVVIALYVRRNKKRKNQKMFKP